MQRRAHKAVAAAAVVLLVVNVFLLLPEDPSEYFDATEYSSRRLDGGKKAANTPRERVINELFKQGIRPGDPNYRRLLKARLERLKKREAKALSKRQTKRTLRNTKNIWYRRGDPVLQAQLEEKVSAIFSIN